MTEAEQIMKRCQAGTRNYEEANNLHAACYGIIGKLLAQRSWVELTKGEVYDLYDSDYVVFHQRIEAKLKQKNGYAEEKNT